MKSELTPTDPYPTKFAVLARYNGEKMRGLVHTDHWKEQMARLQTEYEEWAWAAAPPGMRPIFHLSGWGHGDWQAERPRE